MKQKITEAKFQKVLENIDQGTPCNNCKESIRPIKQLSKFYQMFIEFYKISNKKYSTRLFNAFPDVVEKICEVEKC